jgi:hypothetical protein
MSSALRSLCTAYYKNTRAMELCFLVSLSFLYKIGTVERVRQCLRLLFFSYPETSIQRNEHKDDGVSPRPSLCSSSEKNPLGDLSMFGRSFLRSASVSKSILQPELCSRSVSKRISAKCYGWRCWLWLSARNENARGLALRCGDGKRDVMTTLCVGSASAGKYYMSR